jgi:two-component system, response regulator PdtaR
LLGSPLPPPDDGGAAVIIAVIIVDAYLREEDLTMPRPITIVTADADRTTLDYYRDLLSRLGHQVIRAETGRQLAELCRAHRPDLIVTDADLGDGDGIELSVEASREHEMPVIVVSSRHYSEVQGRARGGRVMAFLVKPVKPEDLAAAIDIGLARFEELRAMRQEVADLRQSLEDRKLVERAKGAVVRRVGVPEADAFRNLRRLASDRNMKLVEVARDVLAAEEIFAELDRL